MRRRSRQLALALALALAACGGSSGSRTAGTPGAKVKLAPVKPAALKEFEAAQRALRLGGPEAAATARARLEKAVELDASLWEAWHDLGVIAQSTGDDAAAVRAYSKALDVNRDHLPTRLARAEAHRKAGDGKAARADYEAVLAAAAEDDPLRRDAAARLASLHRDGKSYDAAVGVLRENLRVAGASSRVYTELGLVYIAQGRLELAALVLARAAEIDAKDPGVYNALALLALRQGKAQEAFDRFDQATKLDPKYIDARFNKASVLLDAGDYVRAKQELTAVIEAAPDDLSARVALGVALRGLKDFDGAKATWERVVAGAPAKNPARVDALFDLAILKADFLEDVAGGKAELERYMQEAPTSHPKRQAAEEKRKELGL
jgi:tetratricopeptide (TPR) repeat protein